MNGSIHVVLVEFIMPPCRPSYALSDHTDRMYLAERIYDYYINTQIYFTEVMKEELDRPLQFLEEQDQWARQQVSPEHLLAKQCKHNLLVCPACLPADYPSLVGDMVQGPCLLHA